MTDKSAAELEMDAQAARARVADTAESIRSKMTPGQLIDEFTGLFAGGDGAVALTNLKMQIRDNPLPLTMVGAGLAWLMLGGGASDNSPPAPRSAGRGDQGRWPNSEDGPKDYGVYSSPGGGISEESRGGTFTGAMDSLTSVAEGAVDTVKDAVGTAKDAVGNTSDRAMRATGELGTAASDMTQRARQSAQEMFQREPLVIAALGLAVGTAIGAMLPGTTVEDEQLGRYRDKLRSTAEDVLERGVEGAKEVAAETYETIKDEADHQALSGSGDTTVVEQIGKVVKSAAATTEQSVREKTAPKRDA